MAATFARILGTEKDRLNCPFYFRIGACRHGDRCSRNHLRPHFSQTLLVPHLYLPSVPLPAIPTSESAANAAFFSQLPDNEEFINFYEDALDELEQYGRVEDLLILQNLGEHMFGNAYIKYSTEEEAERALTHIKGRFYAGRLLSPEYSPVGDFTEAVCGMFKSGYCERGDFCNFMHARPLNKDLKRRLKLASRRRSRHRHRSPSRSRSRSPISEGSVSGEEERESSAERRTRVAEWNAARDREDAEKANKAKAENPNPTS